MLSDQEKERLQAVLLCAFGSPERFSRMLGMATGRRLQDFDTSTDGLGKRARRVIDACEEEGLLHDLVFGAREENARNAALRDFATWFRERFPRRPWTKRRTERLAWAMQEIWYRHEHQQFNGIVRIAEEAGVQTSAIDIWLSGIEVSTAFAEAAVSQGRADQLLEALKGAFPQASMPTEA